MKTQGQPNKVPVNFRLKRQAITLLNLLETQLHTSKTDIVEKALACYAAQKLKSKKNKLMPFAGVLSEKEGDQMLKKIKEDRRNKTIKAKF